MATATFPIAPSPFSWWAALPLILVLTVAALISYATLLAPRFVRFEVSPESLRIRGDIYGRSIPRDRLLLEKARSVNLASDADVRPTMRTNGIGLPNYKSGWFRLKNGDKALAFITDGSRVAYIPTTDGYTLLASVPEPARLIDTLRAGR